MREPEQFFGENQLLMMLYDSRLLPRVGLFRDQEFMSADKFPGVENVAGIMQYRREGVSLVVRGIQRPIGQVRYICSEFAEFGRWPTVHAVAFETPEGISALPPHWDPYPVVTIQTIGHKEWFVFEPFEKDEAVLRKRLEQEGSGIVNAFTAEQHELLKPEHAAYRATLGPGDVLCVPAGWPHYAISTSGRSLHVSICPMPAYVFELFGNEDHELAA